MIMYHILNGDSLLQQISETSIPGQMIVCREILVEGPVSESNLSEFWQARIQFLERDFDSPSGKYEQEVLPEFHKIQNLPQGAEVNLWFEDDLFCQTNMWFVLWLLEGRDDLKMHRVFPIPGEAQNRWRGFGGNMPQQLPAALAARKVMTQVDRNLGVQLWSAYQADDHDALRKLGQTASKAFQDLPDVLDALREKPERIEDFVQKKINSGATTFGEVFRAFCEECGIYGFGDLQIKRIYDSLLS